jgi:hypothetical protein
MTARRAKLRGDAGAPPPAFVVHCSAMAANCGPQQEQAVFDGLVQAYGVYQSQGFLPPALVSYDLYRDVDGSAHSQSESTTSRNHSAADVGSDK